MEEEEGRGRGIVKKTEQRERILAAKRRRHGNGEAAARLQAVRLGATGDKAWDGRGRGPLAGWLVVVVVPGRRATQRESNRVASAAASTMHFTSN